MDDLKKPDDTKLDQRLAGIVVTDNEKKDDLRKPDSKDTKKKKEDYFIEFEETKKNKTVVYKFQYKDKEFIYEKKKYNIEKKKLGTRTEDKDKYIFSKYEFYGIETKDIIVDKNHYDDNDKVTVDIELNLQDYWNVKKKNNSIEISNINVTDEIKETLKYIKADLERMNEVNNKEIKKYDEEIDKGELNEKYFKPLKKQNKEIYDKIKRTYLTKNDKNKITSLYRTIIDELTKDKEKIKLLHFAENFIRKEIPLLRKMCIIVNYSINNNDYIFSEEKKEEWEKKVKESVGKVREIGTAKVKGVKTPPLTVADNQFIKSGNKVSFIIPRDEKNNKIMNRLKDKLSGNITGTVISQINVLTKSIITVRFDNSNVGTVKHIDSKFFKKILKGGYNTFIPPFLDGGAQGDDEFLLIILKDKEETCVEDIQEIINYLEEWGKKVEEMIVKGDEILEDLKNKKKRMDEMIEKIKPAGEGSTAKGIDKSAEEEGEKKEKKEGETAGVKPEQLDKIGDQFDVKEEEEKNIKLITQLIKVKIEQYWNKIGPTPKSEHTKKETINNWDNPKTKEFLKYIISKPSGMTKNNFLKDVLEYNLVINKFIQNYDNIEQEIGSKPIMWMDDGMDSINAILYNEGNKSTMFNYNSFVNENKSAEKVETTGVKVETPVEEEKSEDIAKKKIMNKKCDNCGEDFYGSGIDGKYCSEDCDMEAKMAEFY